MPPASPDNYLSLWDFSLLHYARTGVADTCLRLQDEHGVNVNLLLWCVWLEQCGLPLDAARLRSAQMRIERWDEHYVLPLRQLRRQMKAEFGVADADIELVRARIKQAELLAEQQVQRWLESLVKTWDDIYITNTNPLSVGDNLRFYLQQFNVPESTISLLLDLLDSAPNSVAQERI
jgi:uncharacterized protein (TIGR02444 family)